MSDNGHEPNLEQLNAIDAATAKEDKVCVQTDHTTGQMSWRFATPRGDPYGMMMRCLIWDAIINSDLAKKVVELEGRIGDLTKKVMELNEVIHGG